MEEIARPQRLLCLQWDVRATGSQKMGLRWESQNRRFNKLTIPPPDKLTIPPPDKLTIPPPDQLTIRHEGLPAL